MIRYEVLSATGWAAGVRHASTDVRHYHHIGIPTEHPRPHERYLPHLKMYVSGYETSRYGIEWMRFEPDCPLPDLVKTLPHVAFRVDDLETALQGQDVLIPPNSPSPGIRVAFIVENRAPVEFLEDQTEGLQSSDPAA